MLAAWDNRTHTECVAHESDWDKVLMTMKYLQQHGTQQKKVQGLASYLTNKSKFARPIHNMATVIVLELNYLEIFCAGLPFSVLALLGTVVSNADDAALLAACKAVIVAEEKVTKVGFIQLVKTFIAYNHMAKEVDLLQHNQEVPNAFLAELSQQLKSVLMMLITPRMMNLDHSFEQCYVRP
ncbi:hypothetical protein QOT17_017945 [Balamuthia mandrillaris]